MIRFVVVVVVALLFLDYTAAAAQSVYGQRLVGTDNMVLPVASRLLSSDSHMHVNRGSVLAWDINAPKGSPIYPVAPGVVAYAGCLASAIKLAPRIY